MTSSAGDYLAKPFSLEELLARVQAHLRVLARSRTPTTLRAGRLRLDMVRREADSGSGPHLIRPDGYLAASGVDSIEAYLRRVFVSPLLPALTLGKRASGSWMSH